MPGLTQSRSRLTPFVPPSEFQAAETSRRTRGDRAGRSSLMRSPIAHAAHPQYCSSRIVTASDLSSSPALSSTYPLM